VRIEGVSAEQRGGPRLDLRAERLRLVTADPAEGEPVDQRLLDHDPQPAPTSSSYLIPVDSAAPALVRRCVRWDLGGTGHRVVLGNAQLLASELVTNVVEHTSCTECLVQVTVEAGTIRVAITDDEPVAPPPAPARSSAPRGQAAGLSIVAKVARSWGWDNARSSKTVWFELDLPEEPRR
jgi:hypothetical protein